MNGSFFANWFSWRAIACCEILRCRPIRYPPKPAQAIQKLRHHPAWRIIDYDTDIASAVWKHASKPGFALRKIFDARIGLTLRHHGVTEFATRNVKDVADYGFKRVWNPLDA